MLPSSSTTKPEYGVMASVGFGSLTTLTEKEVASQVSHRIIGLSVLADLVTLLSM